MKDELFLTSDGSHTILSSRYGVSYHSRFGAVQESRHVFIESALRYKALQQKELSVLEMGSPEYAVTRNYLDWMTQVPWGITSKDKLNLKQARKILDEGHEGLDDVKQRILEFLAVGAYKGEIAGSIILLVGPPGVGKTSIGQSIADALGRKFYRFSLGGMRDEAEIKGHRRTYIGAMPGKLVQTLKEVGTQNPVVMLDVKKRAGMNMVAAAEQVQEIVDDAVENVFPPDL